MCHVGVCRNCNCNCFIDGVAKKCVLFFSQEAFCLRIFLNSKFNHTSYPTKKKTSASPDVLEGVGGRALGGGILLLQSMSTDVFRCLCGRFSLHQHPQVCRWSAQVCRCSDTFRSVCRSEKTQTLYMPRILKVSTSARLISQSLQKHDCFQRKQNYIEKYIYFTKERDIRTHICYTKSLREPIDDRFFLIAFFSIKILL